MKEENATVMLELRELLKDVSDKQDQILAEIKALKEEQKKLHDEIRISNFMLNNYFSMGNEILN